MRKRDWIRLPPGRKVTQIDDPSLTVLLPDAEVASEAFMPRTPHQASENAGEISINWDDDPSAIQVTLLDDSGRYGAARVWRTEVEKLSKLAAIGGRLSLSRLPLAGNRYHGNILIREGDRRMMRRISMLIANSVTEVYGQESLC